MKTELNFNKKPKPKSNCLYSFPNWLDALEKGNYKLFVKYYYKLTPGRVKYWRIDPI